MYRKPITLKARAIYSFGLGFGIFVLGVALRTLLDNLGVSGVTAAIDDMLIGLLAGILVFAYERHQHKVVLEKMRVIADMNHHVRNALQAIICCNVLPEQEKQVKLIAESVTRIEWALRKVLPGGATSRAA